MRLAVKEKRLNDALMLLDRMHIHGINPVRGTLILLLFSVPADHFGAIFERFQATGFKPNANLVKRALLHGRHLLLRRSRTLITRTNWWSYGQVG